MVVCEICRKSCFEMTSTKIKDGYICLDCDAKFKAIMGKHNPEQFDSAFYKELMLHPAEAEKIPRNIKASDDACCICGKSPFGGKRLKNNTMLCTDCVENYNETVAGKEMDSNFFAEHDSQYFQEELSECYNPHSFISFNFKTQKIYLKDALRKKNYKVVSFSDILGYNITSPQARFLDVDIAYAGKTIRFHMDDSLCKHYEFDKVVDCFQNVFAVTGKENSYGISSDGIAATGIPQLVCPRCGGTNCMPVVESSTKGKDFSAGKGCCGYALLGPLGILCGACGGGKQSTSTAYWMCTKCGNKFQK